MDLRDGADTMSLTGHSDGVPIEGVDPRVVLYLGLLPNLLLSLHPDYVMTHRMTPLAPDRTQVECAWYFVSTPTSTRRTRWTSGTRPTARTGAPASRCSAGWRRRTSGPGPLAPNEDAVHEFVTTIARGYRDGVLAG